MSKITNIVTKIKMFYVMLKLFGFDFYTTFGWMHVVQVFQACDVQFIDGIKACENICTKYMLIKL
jgi:hypothetical protein